MQPVRRPATSSVAAALAALVVLGSMPGGGALADPLGHEDRTASLYRVVVSMDGEGHPLLPVSVMAGADRVEIRSAADLRVIGTGDGAVEFRVPGSRGVEVTARDPQRGTKQFHVAVAKTRADDMDALRESRQRWRGRGHDVRFFGIGTTYALSGRVLDTRQTVLCVETPFARLEDATRRAAELASKYAEDVFVHTEVAAPPTALLVASAGDHVEVRARDVLWFEGVGSDDSQRPVLVTGHFGHKRKQMELPGRIYVAPGSDGKLVVVNEARIESILEGVVAAEIFSSAPLEALKAQAVAARTDMLAKVGLRHRSDPFAICSEVHCQAYGGTKRVNPNIRQAVKETRGVVMIGAEGRLVDAFYHAVSGGHTEHNENAWTMRPEPNLRGVVDLLPGATDPLASGPTAQNVTAMLAGPDRSWAAASGRNKHALRWTVSRTQEQMAKGLRALGINKPVRDIAVIRRGVSGRATDVELTLADGTKARIHGELRIRRAFSALRSSLFLVRAEAARSGGVPASFEFRGAGYGHGVGMCQTGAVGRAMKGQDLKTITSHYYTDSKLEQLY